MPDNTAKIALLQELLDTGATTAVIDGQTVSVDPASIRKRLRELQATDTANTTKTRPTFGTIDLTGLP